MMRLLYLGDVMAESGIAVLEKYLPSLRQEYAIDMVVAQLENLSEGKGITPTDWERVRAAGVDVGTGGNHSLFRPEGHGLLADPAVPLIRPLNYPAGTIGKGYVYCNDVLVVSLLGHIVGRDADKPTDNALQVIDALLEQEKNTPKRAIVVNLHGDFSSEKIVIGHYLAGRASVVVGDHWHVPTADARILTGGTAHQTDVGMCGVLNSSLGVRYEAIEKRWRDNAVTKNDLETTGPCQLNGLLVTIDEQGQAVAIEPINRSYDT